MARVQSKWYSWGAAKRPRVQPMLDAKIEAMSAELAPASSVLTGVTFSFSREIEAGPNAGFNESMRVCLDPAELERMYAWYQELKSKYGVFEAGAINRGTGTARIAAIREFCDRCEAKIIDGWCKCPGGPDKAEKERRVLAQKAFDGNTNKGR